MDSSHHKLTQPHKEVRGKGGGIFVVRGRRIVGAPILDKHVPSPGPEGLVGLSHEVWWGDVRSGWGGACSTRGRRVRPSCKGRVRCARASTGRCFLMGGEGTTVRQLSGR